MADVEPEAELREAIKTWCREDSDVLTQSIHIQLDPRIHRFQYKTAICNFILKPIKGAHAPARTSCTPDTHAGKLGNQRPSFL